MLTFTLGAGQTIRVTHKGEDLYLELKRKRTDKGSIRYSVDVIGPDTFQIKREKVGGETTIK